MRIESIFLFCFFLLHVSYINGSHFRGGIITWKVINKTDDTILINATIKQGWRRSYGYYTYCDSNAIANQEYIGELGFDAYQGIMQSPYYGVYCTDFSETQDWSYGEAVYIIKYQYDASNTVYYLSYTGAAWIYLLNGGYSWSLITKIDFSKKINNKINEPPITSMVPLINLQAGCYHEIRVPVNDADGDVVKCRWALGNECGDSCYIQDYITLDGPNCLIKLNLTQTEGYYALKLQIEDFDMNDLNNAKSSVSLQFLVYAFYSTQLCSLPKPYFEYPTKPDQACVAIKSNSTYTDIIIVNSNSDSSTITEIQTTSPTGMIKSDLFQYANNTLSKYVNVTWTPSVPGVSLLCFIGVNSVSQTTGQRCISLAAGYNSPVIDSLMPKNYIYANNTQWILKTDKNLTRPVFSSFIKFIENSTNTISYQVDISTSNTVLINHNELIIQTSIFLKEKNMYYVTLDYGALTSTEACNVNGDEINNPQFWSFYVHDTQPPQILFLNPPKYVFDSIEISWLIDETAYLTCELVYLTNKTNIDCSRNNSVLLSKLLIEGNYKFLIYANDLENNKAVYIHEFYVDQTPPILNTNWYESQLSKYYASSYRYFYFSASDVCEDSSPVNVYCESSIVPNQWQLCSANFLDNLENGKSYYVNVKCVDSANITSLESKNISFTVDLEPPIILFIQNMSVGCDISPQTVGFATTEDNLSTNITLDYYDEIDTMCQIRRTWSAKDEAGNQAQSVQILQQQKEQNKSDINASLKNNSIKIDCEIADYYLKGYGLLDTVLAESKCGRQLNIFYNDTRSDIRCNVTINRKWIISDSCNSNIELMQEIFINPCKLKCNNHGLCTGKYQ